MRIQRLAGLLVWIVSLTCFCVPVSGQKRQPDVWFEPTPQELVEAMLEMAGVTKDDVVYDLGCGDGRFVITAAKKFGARGVGVDIDPVRIRESNENARKEGVTNLVRFVEKDLFETDISEATVVQESATVALAVNVKAIKSRAELAVLDNDLSAIGAQLKAAETVALETQNLALAQNIAELRARVVTQGEAIVARPATLIYRLTKRQIHFVLPRKVGEVVVTGGISVPQALEAMAEVMRQDPFRAPAMKPRPIPQSRKTGALKKSGVSQKKNPRADRP